MIHYFNFKRHGQDYLLTNDLGCYAFLKPEQFRQLLQRGEVEDPAVQKRLRKDAFVYSSSRQAFAEDQANRIRVAKDYLFQATQLHIFVVATACNMQCVYCQAQNGSDIPYDLMTQETAKKAVDLALQSPSTNLQFEFQGGEPLLNFLVIRFIVEYSQNCCEWHNVSYSIVTNLSMLTEEMLVFIAEHNISISTSLDGDSTVHNANRPYRTGMPTYQDVLNGISRVKEHNIPIGALMTTTRTSLHYPRQIVDTYISQGFQQIVLRALTPLGCANKRWDQIGYEPTEFLQFYRQCFDYILQINLEGTYLAEGMASIFLKKILSGISVNYMELRSPCGASVGQIAYYCDGSVYTCDEGRMLSEMGINAFRLGSVETDTYDCMMDSRRCKGICAASILESLPSCADCVYQPYCGVCPAVNYALDRDLYEKRPNNYRCQIYGGILDILFEKLHEDDDNIKRVFRSWIQ